MTPRPQSVIDAMDAYYREYSACAGRSNHALAKAVTEKVDETRSSIAHWLGAKRKEEIVFVRNATEAMNLVANSLDLVQGDIVLTSDKEHNSNLIPWQLLAKRKGVIHRTIPTRPDGTWDMERFQGMMDGRVRLVSLVMTSNLDGVTFPIEEIAEIVHRHGALMMVDAAQSFAHDRLSVSELGADFLAFSGHKAFGPTGTGALYGKYDLLDKLEPFMVGGSTVEDSTYEGYELFPPPAKFESGLQDYAGIVGLGAAMDFLKTLDLDEVRAHEEAMNRIASEPLLGNAKVRILGPADASSRGAILSFAVEGLPHHQLALMLEQEANVMVRSGRHCVHSWFNSRGVAGSVRASFSVCNTEDEARAFAAAVDKALKII